MSELISNLQWRHAVKAYKPTKKVPDEHVAKIIEAARLAPSAYGLQPFKVLLITNPELKTKLDQHVKNTNNMKNCSHALVFAGWDQYSESRFDQRFEHNQQVRNLERSATAEYEQMLRAALLPKDPAQQHDHIARQVYIALGMALAQAAELRVDCTPVEGFDAQAFDQILDLPTQGLRSVVVMYIGVAEPENDWNGKLAKVRQPLSDFLVEYK